MNSDFPPTSATRRPGIVRGFLLGVGFAALLAGAGAAAWTWKDWSDAALMARQRRAYRDHAGLDAPASASDVAIRDRVRAFNRMKNSAAGSDHGKAQATRTTRDEHHRDYALLIPWLEDGAIAQILDAGNLGDPQPLAMPKGVAEPIRAMTLVRAPARVVYACITDMADWPRFVPRVKAVTVTSSEDDANRFRTVTEIALPLGNAVYEEEYECEPYESVVGRIPRGDFTGWVTWRLHPVRDGRWTVVEHRSRVKMNQFVIRAFVQKDPFLEATVNQSAMCVRLEAIKRKAEALAAGHRGEIARADSALAEDDRTPSTSPPGALHPPAPSKNAARPAPEPNDEEF